MSLNKTTLFLDDDPIRTKKFKSEVPSAKTASTAQEMISLLESNSVDFVFLDHDLGDEHYVDSNRDDCGMEVVRWIIKNKPEIGLIIIHTHNHFASDLMEKTLNNSNYKTKVIPFCQMDWDYIQENIFNI